jgi:hypothetical protein
MGRFADEGRTELNFGPLLSLQRCASIPGNNEDTAAMLAIPRR